MALVNMGSYYGSVTANINLVDIFRNTEKSKHPNIYFPAIRKIAIEAPAKTEITINDVDIIMPSTGIFELGLDFVQIDKLIFKSNVVANIVYMY